MICTLAAFQAASADGRVIPLQGLPIPKGGAAVIYGKSGSLQVGGSFCCTLIVVAPSGVVFYEPGSAVKIPDGADGRKTQDAWRRIRGTLSSRMKIDQKLARDFIKATNSIRIPATSTVAADVARSVPCPGGRCAETIYAVIRDGKLHSSTISNEQEFAILRLGLLPGRDGVTLAQLLPADSVGLAYEQSLFIVRRTGAVTIQYGYLSMKATTHEPLWLPASATYTVELISATFASRLVDDAPHADVPDGCPALDTLTNYHLLEVVTRDHVSNSLFCYPSAPMRDELMQVVRKVYSL